MIDIFGILGLILTVFFILVVLLLLITILLVSYSVKTKKVLFPGFILFVLDFLYYPLKILTEKLGLRKGYIDMISNDMRNFIYYKELSKIPFENRILLLPQCLRKRDCPAILDSMKGFQCTNCGRCGIGDLINFCNEKSINVFIVPGGSFVKKVIKLTRPKAIIGVGCHIELREASLVLEYLKIPGRGINLEKDGCVETKVNYEKIKKAVLIAKD
ncbi:MAG: hypothetical protein APG12_00985 [Candidatus Methanofastidiosum methylothiophilum]|uniref:DUF116 domain-containing protein n=1 Tax=Candidatus Methanofastidiosum methylothiophilum TaxID=1705564 RepID=A0A150IYU9_9EURY|nr:MAG: hypothetical protein APG10_01203 [Candidatus Methanofastidiosum methylthiophilus]KYC47565.1 MAG: hypothetical protein APG11_01066 [Candidatus Methanofastidiosum methylthiophilus]KYC50167.1 MAG: hypothetical protein APG12_00985 [Candidatus Methanofastidiosum methylthiophilus]